MVRQTEEENQSSSSLISGSKSEMVTNPSDVIKETEKG